MYYGAARLANRRQDWGLLEIPWAQAALLRLAHQNYFAFGEDLSYKRRPLSTDTVHGRARAQPYSRGAIISDNPCLECGACCAFYRASFYWGETDEITLGGVPADLTVKINERFVAMQGTRCHPPRCVALMGAIGVHVSCRIYERRASVCRSFPPSWEDNVHKPPL